MNTKKRLLTAAFLIVYVLGGVLTLPTLLHADTESHGDASKIVNGTQSLFHGCNHNYTKSDIQGNDWKDGKVGTTHTTDGTFDRCGLQDLLHIAKTVLDLIIYGALLLAIVALMIVGSKLVFASFEGNAKALGDAKRNLMWVVVGIIVALLAWLIVDLIFGTLAGTNTKNKGIEGMKTAVLGTDGTSFSQNYFDGREEIAKSIQENQLDANLGSICPPNDTVCGRPASGPISKQQLVSDFNDSKLPVKDNITPGDIKSFEALEGKASLKAYEDPKGSGKYSIGFGHNGVSKDATITEAEAEKYFNEDLQKFDKKIKADLGDTMYNSLSDQRKSALLDLYFNTGGSGFTEVKNKVKAKQWCDAAWEIYNAKRTEQKQVPLVRILSEVKAMAGDQYENCKNQSWK